VQVRLGKMSDLLDALMEQFPMPPPALFAANDVDKCAPQQQPAKVCLVQGLLLRLAAQYLMRMRLTSANMSSPSLHGTGHDAACPV